MKRNIILFVAAAVALLSIASCNRKVEYQFDTYATLYRSSFSVSEDAGELRIPVLLKNKNGDAQISVKVTDGSAEVDFDYEVISPSNDLLSFTGDTDSLDIVIKILTPELGQFTGSKDFAVTLSSVTAGVSVGAYSQAVVTIDDVDHPLAPILGEYTATGQMASGGTSWVVKIDKHEDLTKVNFIGLADFGETLVGNINEAMTLITIPFGQMYVASGYDTLFVGWGAGGYYMPSGNLILTKTETGWEMSCDGDDSEMSWGYGALAVDGSGSPLGWLDYVLPGTILTKN